MREILFRGKPFKGANWMYGYYSEHQIPNTKRVSYLTSCIGGRIEVDKKSVGQYTGLCDKNGKRIYEGDIVLQKGYHGKKIPMLVRFECGAFIVGYHKGSSTKDAPMLLNAQCEVIGNIYDNPELCFNSIRYD